MLKRLLMAKVLADPDNALKIVLIVTAAALLPFMILISIIGAAASSVSGFLNTDSGEDFDPEKFRNSEVVTILQTWYEEYLSEYEISMNDRKAEVENDNTTIERTERPKSGSAAAKTAALPAGQEEKVNVLTIKIMNDPKFTGIAIDGTEEMPGRGPSPSRPDTPSGKHDTVKEEESKEESSKESVDEDKKEGESPGSGESEEETTQSDRGQETEGSTESDGNHEGDESTAADEGVVIEEHEVCHVNVIISMGEFPLSAVLSYYNLLGVLQTINGGDNHIAYREQINEMLRQMTVYEEKAAEDSEDYYLSMHFKDYRELPETIFTTWGLSREEYEEYSDIYINVTQMVAGWIGEDPGSFNN